MGLVWRRGFEPKSEKVDVKHGFIKVTVYEIDPVTTWLHDVFPAVAVTVTVNGESVRGPVAEKSEELQLVILGFKGSVVKTPAGGVGEIEVVYVEMVQQA